jgi:hypothetical protein
MPQAGLTLLVSLVVVLGVLVGGTTGLVCSSVEAGGFWHVPSTWQGCGGAVPGAGDTATIGSDGTYGPVTIAKNTSVTVLSVSVWQSALYIQGTGHLVLRFNSPFQI